MNIEELSKSQLILLMLLINFVTSVATGILTVSLLDQASPVVTQTINRVVDHTIERVVEAAPIIAPAPSNQDLVTGAIAANAARAVGVYRLSSGTSTPALGIGTYLPEARAIVTATVEGLPKEALVEFANGASVPASLAHEGNGLTVYGFSDTATLPKIASPTLVAAKNLKLGQTVLAITIDGSAATGIVSRVDGTGVRTTLPDIGAGSAVVDLSGHLVGIAGAGALPGALLSADVITALLTPPVATP